MGSLLVAGTTSDAGQSVVTTGLCRALSRRSAGPDGCRRLAARAEPESAMNPVLLKPGSDLRSHVVVRGRPARSTRRRSSTGGRCSPRRRSRRTTTSPLKLAENGPPAGLVPVRGGLVP
ncbi:MAG: hypothetical protein ACXWW7_00030 [Nocardioides sp.]